MSSDKTKHYQDLALLFVHKHKYRRSLPHFEIADREEALAAFDLLTEEEKKAKFKAIRERIYNHQANES